MKKHLIKIIIVCLILLLIPLVWFGRYRFYQLQPNEFFELMKPQNLEGYTDKVFYTVGDTIKLFVRATTNSNIATVRKMIDYQQTVELHSIYFDKIEQEINETQSEFGCDWKIPLKFFIDENFEKGYYNIQLKTVENEKTFEIYFMISDGNNSSEIAYLANVSTWNAYNYWGGKSLYRNILDNKNVHFVSLLRPNVSYSSDHLIEIEANGYHWLKKQNYDIDVFPDFILEQNPKLLENKKLIVLPYHAEYFSSEMYKNLENLIYSGRSLLALGANQIHWKIKWKNDFTLMECRKDMTFFDDGFLEYGGMWRHRFKPPEKFLGTRFTRAGMHTYAPYRVVNSKHWLYSGLDLRDGDIFGLRGIDNRPISGVETDKISFLTPKNFEIIAKGMNPIVAPGFNVYYSDARFDWNGSGGGDFVFRELSDTNAILNSAAIHSVSGLGADTVFTTIIRNFLSRYYK